MMIHDITAKVGRHRRRTRVGRGESSGLGKTSGRGHKGAKSRSGWSLNPQYQGGQINFIQKMPKRGFTNAEFKKHFHVINVQDLETLADAGGEITIETLAAAGLVRDAKLPLKVLGEGELTKKVSVTAAKFSATAKAKIEKAGGTATEIVKVKWSRETAAKASGAPAKAKTAKKKDQDEK
jgi:large subunit ribosomal protein L15